MSDFAGMEELLQDFLQEATDLLSDVDNKLVDLEKTPDEKSLLNDIFRGFHTIKGGAGFLNATELVTLCHLTENLFDKLRNDELQLTPELMDLIMSATQGVREMFGELTQSLQPQPADPALLDALRAVIQGGGVKPAAPAPAAPAPAAEAPAAAPAAPASQVAGEPDWNAVHAAMTEGGVPPSNATPANAPHVAAAATAAAPKPAPKPAPRAAAPAKP